MNASDKYNKNNRVILSLFTPVYNSEKFIEHCLKSVLCQKVTDFEWFIHDDGSTDSTYSICEAYAKKDKRIHLKKEKNGTSIQAMNNFIDDARGDFIAFIDHDDYIDSDYFSSCLKELIKTGSDCAIASYTCVDSDDNKLDWYVPQLENGLVLSREKLKKKFLTSLDIEGFRWNKIYKTSIVKQSKLKLQDIFPADIQFEFELFNHISSAVLVNNNGYYYRQTNSSEVRSLNINKCKGMLTSICNISGQASSLGLNIEAEYYRIWRYINLMFIYIHENKLQKNELKILVNEFSWQKIISKNILSTLILLCKYKDKKHGYIKFALKAIYVWLKLKLLSHTNE